MRNAGVQGVSRRKPFPTTVRDETARPAPDLVDRQFTATGPDRLWVADITYAPTWAGFRHLAFVLAAWSRRIAGWAMESHLRTELVLAALDMAVAQRRPTEVIHHSDQGCQYTSLAFGRRCGEAGVRPSMGSVGDAYDNGELLRDARVRVARSRPLPHAGRRAPRHLRLHRRLVQSAASTFRARLPLAHDL